LRPMRSRGNRLPAWKVEHSKKEQNSAAHELAQLAKRTKHSAVWRLRCPMCIEQIVAQECNNSISEF
ncbi:hypothetical protein BAE44_0015116, partial [Dichanthelium oligosanthes]